MKRLKVETERLVLRPLRKADHYVWYQSHVNCGPALNRWDSGPGNPKKFSKERFEKLILRYRELAQSDDYYFYAAFLKETGELVGHIDFDVFLRSTHQFANFGYRIYNPYWGHGYGREAAMKGLEIGFNHLKLNRLEAAINLDNKKSIRLCKKIGMRKEGVKKRYWFEDGEWADQLIYVANPEDVGFSSRNPF